MPLMVAAALLLSVAPVRAQENPADSTWSDGLVLDPNDFDFAGDQLMHYSSGWFPSAFASTSLIAFTDVLYSDIFDRGDQLRSSSFVDTPFAFTWHDPFAGGEQNIYKPNSSEETDDHPHTSYDEYALGYLIGLPMPLILRVKGAFQMQDGLIFSLDTTRSFLGYDGRKRSLKEVGVVYLEEYLIGGTAGVQIPIYGVFFNSEMTTISSYYYLHASIGGTYAIVSRGTQYEQIANAKDEIRYGNGQDTVTLQSKTRFDQLRRFRTNYEFGLGWNVSFESFVFDFETFITVPITPVLRDTDWKQFTAGLRVGLGYQWL